MSLFGKDFLKEGADSGKVHSFKHVRYSWSAKAYRVYFRATSKGAINFTLTSMLEKAITVPWVRRVTAFRVDTPEVIIYDE